VLLFFLPGVQLLPTYDEAMTLESRPSPIPSSEPLEAKGGDVEDMSIAMIDLQRQRFPHCVVWSPIPLLTWLLPFIGHMGIADKEGKEYAG